MIDVLAAVAFGSTGEVGHRIVGLYAIIAIASTHIDLNNRNHPRAATARSAARAAAKVPVAHPADQQALLRKGCQNAVCFMSV